MVQAMASAVTPTTPTALLLCWCTCQQTVLVKHTKVLDKVHQALVLMMALEVAETLSTKTQYTL